jgi:serine/threonine protein kinase
MQNDLMELQQFRKNKRNFFKLMESWLPPTMALIFVLSLELGRRIKATKRREQESALRLTQSTESIGTMSNSGVRSIGVIQVTDDVLGFGGHGTVVYRGTLDGRQVAVKRMLKAYHASADREISLLIESDGHPNVVRYFLKEVTGDFVYLALELCDMSLHDLIVKLRQYTQAASPLLQPQLMGVTKATLYQIACGVRHLHSLRIVHR